MDIKKSTKLPDGVGKKIIEALKKQESTNTSHAEEQTAFLEPADVIENINNEEYTESYDVSSTEELSWDQDYQDNTNVSLDPDLEDFMLDSTNEENFVQDNPNLETFDSKPDEDYEYKIDKEEYIDENSLIDNKEPEYNSDIQEFYDNNPLDETTEEVVIQEEKIEYEKFVPKYNPKKPERPVLPKEEPFQRPKPNRLYEEDTFEATKYRGLELNPDSNVSILMRLIARLPAGVTRQTGAQIIRQTLEAMGISMNKVLTEAQQLQDELAQSVRDSINTIEEYRNNIRTLEKEVQNYRKQTEELEDLISLFIISDKNLKR